MNICFYKKNLSLLFILGASLVMHAQITNLKLASDAWPPFTNESTKKSLALDIVNEALTRSQISVDHEIIDFEKVLTAINNEEIDGCGAIWKTSEREETLLFSKPYLENRLVLVGLKGRDVSFTKIAELTGYKIGLVANYAYDANVLNAQNFEIVYSTNDQENLEKLFDKTIDYMLVDELLIHYLFKHQINDVEKYLSIAEVPFQIKKLHLAIRKNIPNATEIINRFNEAIHQMMLDGTYTNILNMDSILTDVDGDGITELIINSNYTSEELPKKAYPLFYGQHEKNQTTKVYVNGKDYKDWNLAYKNKKLHTTIEVSNDIYNPGVRIKTN